MAELSPKEKEFMARVLDYALNYAKRGWHIFPVHSVTDKGECTCNEKDCSRKGKHPRVLNWEVLATTDAAQIEKWFGANAPLSNIGIACGSASGLSVVDLDVSNAKNGIQNYLDLANAAGEKTTAFKTLSVETGSGGRHLYFKFNSILTGATDCFFENSGIDVRTKGNLVVAPPSRHISKNEYKFVKGTKADTPILDFPEFLLSKFAVKRGFVMPKKKKPTLDELRQILEKVPNKNYDYWYKTFLACGRLFYGTDEADDAYQICKEWAARDYEQDSKTLDRQYDFFYRDSQDVKRANPVGIATVIFWARQNGFTGSLACEAQNSPVEDYVFFELNGKCIYKHTGAEHLSTAVNSTYQEWMWRNGFKKKKAVDLILSSVVVKSKTYAPQFKERIIFDYVSDNGVLTFTEGANLWNTYKAPVILKGGDASKAGKWVDHVRRLMPREGDAEQFINYLAHRVQRPWEKPRYALLIGGEQGIGKDTLISAATPAWGYCNEGNISPSQIMGGFNEYAENVLIRVNETADLSEGNRWQLYEKAKVLIAGTPDQMELNPKYGSKYTILLCCGVIFTTNHLDAGAIFIDKDDRRFDVIQCAKATEIGLVTKEQKAAFFKDFWYWLKKENGFAHVQRYLLEKDISNFEPAAHRVTDAHRELALAGSTADEWFLDIIDKISKETGLKTSEYPKVLSFAVVKAYAENAGEKNSFAKRSWLNFGRAGFKRLQNKETRDGRFSVKSKKHSLWILDEAGFDENAALDWANAHPQILEMPHCIGGAGVDNGSPPWQD